LIISNGLICLCFKTIIDYKCAVMKNKILFYIFNLSCLAVFAQDNERQKEIDKFLRTAQNSTIDTVKINAYQKVCDLYAQVDNDKLAIYNNYILKLSKKINYQKGFGFYYYNKSCIFSTANAEKKKKYAEKAKAIFLKEKDINYYLLSIYSLSFAYVCLEQYDKAKKEIEANLVLAKKDGDFVTLGHLYEMLGQANDGLGNLGIALINYKESLLNYKKYNIKTKLPLVYYSMSAIQHDLKNYNLALYYVDLSIADSHSAYFEHGVKIQKVVVLNELHLYDRALVLAKENDIFFNEASFKDTDVYYYSKQSLADCYLYLKRYKAAIETLKKIENVPDDPELAIGVFVSLSNSYTAIKQINTATWYADKALVLIDSVNKLNFKSEAYLNKYEVEKVAGNYETALLFHEKYLAIAEKQNAKINKEKLLELQTEFEVTDKESKIKSIEVASLQKSNQIDKQRSYLMYGGFGLVLVLLSILVFIKVYRTIKKKNTIISENNIALQSSIIEKEILLKEIHHRVKNNLQLVMSLLNIQSQEVDNTMDDFLSVSRSRIISMSLIHESLYQTENLSKVDFKAYVTKLTEYIVASQNNLHTDIQLKIEMEEIYFDIQTAVPLGLIINELVNNAYKHAFKKQQRGLITLVLKQTEDSYELLVRDDGTGVSVEPAAKKTLGMELVQQLVLQIRGVLQVQNNLGLSYNILFKNQTITYEE
jgi:two-component system, sensor histidine kinase PdtaS